MIFRRRFLVPEVVQTSAMDCGPAALKALLNGFGINASYGRLREASQTDVDGTSIDTLEETAKQLGLDAEQVMTLPDHLFESDENLPREGPIEFHNFPFTRSCSFLLSNPIMVLMKRYIPATAPKNIPTTISQGEVPQYSSARYPI